MDFDSCPVSCRVSSWKQEQIQNMFVRPLLLFTPRGLLSKLYCLNSLPSLNYFSFLIGTRSFHSSPPPLQDMQRAITYSSEWFDALYPDNLLWLSIWSFSIACYYKKPRQLNMPVHAPRMCRAAGEGSSQVRVEGQGCVDICKPMAVAKSVHMELVLVWVSSSDDV